MKNPSFFIISPAFRRSNVGERVLNPTEFIESVEFALREHLETLETLETPEPPFLFLPLPLDEVKQLVSPGYGPRTSSRERYHLRDGRRYLKREAAFPVENCQVCLFTAPFYQQAQKRAGAHGESLPVIGSRVSHVLTSVIVNDKRPIVSSPRPIWPVADELHP